MDSTMESTMESKKKTSSALFQETISDIKIMSRFALMKGKIIEISMNSYEENMSLDELLIVHAFLCNTIKPATPKSIIYSNQLNTEDLSINKQITSFYRIPIIRKLLILSILFILIFIGTGITSDINQESMSALITDQSGVGALIGLIFISASAGLGVIFSIFKKVIDSLKDGSLSEEDNVYYSVLIILGVIAGIVLTKAFHFDTGSFYAGVEVDNVFLAFLGGFSIETLRSILDGILGKIKSIFFNE
jgi:hypothetical protein